MSSRTTLVLVLTAFAAPFLLAWLLNFGPWPWRPAAVRNHGTLIQPPPRMLVTAAHDMEGAPVPASEFEGRWNLIYASEDACGDLCQRRLTDMHRTWLALGKDARRVQRWHVRSSVGTAGDAADPALRIVTAAAGQDTLSGALREAMAPDARAGETVFLMDPLGYVILRYPPDLGAADMVSDLERLLKYSAVDR